MPTRAIFNSSNGNNVPLLPTRIKNERELECGNYQNNVPLFPARVHIPGGNMPIQTDLDTKSGSSLMNQRA